MSAFLSIDSLCVRYGDQFAVKGLSLAVERGEFVTLLGPSGCGKTTTLRAVAGFVKRDRRTISVEGRDLGALPPHRRNIGMVFQSYALFPHLTVGRKRRLRPAHAPHFPRWSGTGGRPRPWPWWGWALRSIAIRPSCPAASSSAWPWPAPWSSSPQILLLDEPLSNLDANLRAELRTEIRGLQSRLGITTLLVTHDQQEALAVSDRVAVLNEGRIVDIGAPEALCDRPSDPFAAAFIGGRTVIGGEVREGVFEAPGLLCAGAPEGAREIVLRGPRLRLGAPEGPLHLQGSISSRTYLGDTYEVDVTTPSGRVRVVAPSDQPPPAVGEPCRVSALPGGVSFI